MKVLVTGGTGFVGSNLCRELATRGHDVTALARTPAEDGVPEGVEGVVGDVTAYDSIADPIDGQDVVVNLVALSPLFRPRGGNGRHDEVHRQGTENVVRAAEAGGVERVVQMSGLDAAPDAPTHYLRAKGRGEAVVRGSDLDWTIFRPSVIFGEGDEFVGFTKLLTPPYLAALPGGGKTRFQPIFVEEVVAMMADACEDDDHAGESYEIGGPEVLTLAEVARLAWRAEGRPVNIIPVPMPLAKVGLTLGGLIPGFPLGPDQYRSLKLDSTVPDNDVTAFGVDPETLTTLSEYLGLEEG